ncbi:Neuritin, partial [Ophiophagus hannah]
MVLICSPAYLVQAVKEASKCDAVFKGFSDCVVKMGQNIANYPQDLDDKKNLETICRSTTKATYLSSAAKPTEQPRPS